MMMNHQRTTSTILAAQNILHKLARVSTVSGFPFFSLEGPQTQEKIQHKNLIYLLCILVRASPMCKAQEWLSQPQRNKDKTLLKITSGKVPRPKQTFINQRGFDTL